MSTDQLGLMSERPSPLAQPTPESGAANGEASAAAEAQPTFDQLGLTPDLLRTVAAQGYTVPTPVQAQSIPLVLAGRDLLAGAQTGTGKTAAFVLPILQLLNANRPAPRVLAHGERRPRGATLLPIRCLVLTPTRELALQIEESVRTYGAERPIFSTTIYGGVGFDPQVRAIRTGPEIVVATPGRLLDHAGQGTIDLSQVEILVLDEADRMLDMGFIRDIRRIIALIPARRQNLLFSATFSDEIQELSAGLLNDPAHVQIARRNAPIELVRQVVYPVDRERKRELLSHLIKTGRIDRALVFTRTKHGANRLAEQLEMDGIKAGAIHGNKSQGQRVRALDDFKEGRVAVLVATEVASRGIDIDGLPHVVNFEMPMVAQDYVHRIGRTGRAGMEGDAVSLVCIDENLLLADIETLLRQRITREVIPGFEVDRSIPREAIRQRSVGGGRQGTPRPAPRQPSRPARRPMFPEPRPAVSVEPRPQAPAGFRPANQNGFAPTRPAAPAGPRPMAPSGFRPAASSGPRQAATMEFRRPIPNDFRPSTQNARPQSAPSDFRQVAQGGPRQPGGFRRPTAGDFDQSPQSGPRREPGGFRPAAPGGFRGSAPTGFSNSGRPQSRYDSVPHYDSAPREGFAPRNDPQPRYDLAQRHESPARPAQGPAGRSYNGRPAQGPAGRTYDRPGISAGRPAPSAGRPASGGYRSGERGAPSASQPDARIARRGGRQG
jgi:ATP-dependent RNA helicase RhlE